MKKTSLKYHIRSPVSPCGGYHLSWKKPGKLTVISHVNYKPLLELTENTGTIVRAACSGNYRRILCQNQDGSVGTWDMTQRKPKISYGGRDIIEYLLNNDPEYAYTLRRISRH